MIHALVDAHALTGEGRYRQVAEEALATVATLAEKAPRFAGWSLAAAQTMLDGPLEVAVVGPAGADRAALALPRPAAPRCRRGRGGRPARRHTAPAPAGPRSTAARRRTCAVASCASGRSPRRRSWRPQWPRRAMVASSSRKTHWGMDVMRTGDPNTSPTAAGLAEPLRTGHGPRSPRRCCSDGWRSCPGVVWVPTNRAEEFRAPASDHLRGRQPGHRSRPDHHGPQPARCPSRPTSRRSRSSSRGWSRSPGDTSPRR